MDQPESARAMSLNICSIMYLVQPYGFVHPRGSSLIKRGGVGGRVR